MPVPLEKIEASARDVGRRIGSSLPEGVGFLLVLYDYGSGGNMTYLSNGQRQDCINLLIELLGRLVDEGGKKGKV